MRKKPEKEYTFDITLSKTARAAHCLDWLATSSPRHFFSWAVITKMINGYRSTPRETSDEVIHLRSSGSRIRKLLTTRYNRGMIVTAGTVRATVNSEDVMRTELPRKEARLEGAIAAVQETVAIVDLKELPNTEDGDAMKKHLRGLRVAMKQIAGDDFLGRLRPPLLEAKKDE